MRGNQARVRNATLRHSSAMFAPDRRKFASSVPRRVNARFRLLSADFRVRHNRAFPLTSFGTMHNLLRALIKNPGGCSSFTSHSPPPHPIPLPLSLVHHLLPLSSRRNRTGADERNVRVTLARSVLFDDLQYELMISIYTRRIYKLSSIKAATRVRGRNHFRTPEFSSAGSSAIWSRVSFVN